MNRRRLSYILTVVLILSYASVAFAGRIDEKQSELDGIKGDIKETQGQIEGVKGEQASVADELAKLEEDLKSNKLELENIEKELIEVQEDIETTKEELKDAIKKGELHKELMDERLCAMYMSSGVSYLEILFEAKSFTDLLDRLVMVREIVSLDQKVLSEMQQIQAEIKEKKEHLEAQEKAVEDKKEEAIRRRNTIEQKQERREELLIELKDQQQKLEQDLAQLEKDSKEVERIIQRYIAEEQEKERKRKEAEQRRREEAERREKEKKEQEKEKEEPKAEAEQEQQGNKTPDRGGSSNKPDNPPPSPPQNTGGSMAWPVPGYHTITSPYGPRTHPITGEPQKPHEGIDIAGPGISGKEAVAALDGTVISAGWIGGYGNSVIIAHDNGLQTLYAHGSSVLVSRGDRVKRGQAVIRVGSSGNSTGPHLHFEVRKSNGSTVNPMNYLR